MSITSTIESNIVTKEGTPNLVPTATKNAVISSELYVRQWDLTSSIPAWLQLENTEVAQPMIQESGLFPAPTPVVTRWLPSRPTTILPVPTAPVGTDPDPKNNIKDARSHDIIAIAVLSPILVICLIGVGVILILQCYRHIRHNEKHNGRDIE